MSWVWSSSAGSIGIAGAAAGAPAAGAALPGDTMLGVALPTDPGAAAGVVVKPLNDVSGMTGAVLPEPEVAVATGLAGVTGAAGGGRDVAAGCDPQLEIKSVHATSNE